MGESSKSANAVIFTQIKGQCCLLLIRRTFTPFEGSWALPGGFLKEGEGARDGIRRELKKEIGMEVDPNQLIPLSKRDHEGRDPRGPNENHSFLLVQEEGDLEGLEVGEGVSEVLWFPIQKVDDLAFDHGAILCEAMGKFWTLMPSHAQGLDSSFFPAEFSEKGVKPNRPLAYFGGSFNPWHDGHRACVNLCPNRNLVVVPDFSPFKQKSNIQNHWKVYRDICEGLKDTPVAVYPGFCGLEGPNPTVEWLPKAKGAEKELLVGQDNYQSLLTWTGSNELLKVLSKIYVVPRNVEALKKDVGDSLKKHNQKLVIERLAEHKHLDLSSTQLRREASGD